MICQFYNTPSGCRFGSQCRNRHAREPETVKPSSAATSSAPASATSRDTVAPSPGTEQKNVLCRWILQEDGCRYGDDCWFSHDVENLKSGAVGEECCGICLEVITNFGLLEGCDHAFCIECINQWRNEAKAARSTDDLESKRGCPLCRCHSDFIIPSYKYATGEEKKRLIADRLAARSSIPCRDFSKDGTCKFGRHCFYAHLDSNGNDVKKESTGKAKPSDDDSDDEEVDIMLSNSILLMMISRLRRMHGFN